MEKPQGDWLERSGMDRLPWILQLYHPTCKQWCVSDRNRGSCHLVNQSIEPASAGLHTLTMALQSWWQGSSLPLLEMPGTEPGTFSMPSRCLIKHFHSIAKMPRPCTCSLQFSKGINNVFLKIKAQVKFWLIFAFSGICKTKKDIRKTEFYMRERIQLRSTVFMNANAIRRICS